MSSREVVVGSELITRVRDTPVPGQPKIKASTRTCPLPHPVVSATALHLAGFPPVGNGLVFTLDELKRSPDMPSTGYGVPLLPRRASRLGRAQHALRHY